MSTSKIRNTDALMVESFQIKMDFMNYATTVDPDYSVRPLYDQSTLHANIACTFYQRKKMYAHADLELQLLHILLNSVFIIWRDSCYFCVG